MMTSKPTFKVSVLNIEEGLVHVTLNDKTILLPQEMFSQLPKVGDEFYIALQTHEDYKKHHEHLSKSILNKIFRKNS